MGTFIITTASHTDTGKQVCRHRPRWAHFWVDWENLGGEVTLRTYPKPFRRAFDFDFCNQHHHLRHALTRVVTVFRFVSVAAKFGGSPPHPHPISLAACKRSSPNYIRLNKMLAPRRLVCIAPTVYRFLRRAKLGEWGKQRHCEARKHKVVVDRPTLLSNRLSQRVGAPSACSHRSVGAFNQRNINHVAIIDPLTHEK